ncbi:reverse transcriptase [Quillaja saponaria]|uniref:Reverse transcriptase n=1 Tax=Quillaja saponaria TaxID=32244 RepID=A0AAD7LFR4_QUISA|nr:reverse transcriptase [Quillaja saponaria]
MLRIIFGGPYVIAKHFLTIRKWVPCFKPSEAKISFITCVRIPGFPVECYRDEVLYAAVAAIGKPIKIDIQTALATRSGFARLCVELDLENPLVAKVWVRGEWRLVEYKGLDQICFKGGRVGHHIEWYSHGRSVIESSKMGPSELQGTYALATTMVTEAEGEVVEEDYSPWMLVKRKSRRPYANIGESSKVSPAYDRN